MTDSSAGNDAEDGPFDVGPSADDLFGDVDDGSTGPAPADRSTPTTADDDVEDRTAADVFQQLRTEVDRTTGTDEVLAGESPEDIIESADEPREEQTLDEDLIDEAALEDLLLTGRREEDEFLWVETSDDGDSVDDDDSVDGDDSTDVVESTDDPETSGDVDSADEDDTDGRTTSADAGSTGAGRNPKDADRGVGRDGPSGVLDRLRSRLDDLL